MNNEFNSVTAIYKKHDRYVLGITINGTFVHCPMISAKTMEPLDGCVEGDEINVEIQSWVLIDHGLQSLVKKKKPFSCPDCSRDYEHRHCPECGDVNHAASECDMLG